MEARDLDESLLADLWSLLTSDASAALVDAAHEETLLAHLHGRLSIDVERGRELTDFVELPFAEAIAFFKGKRLLTPDEFKRLDDSSRRHAFTIAGLHQRYALERAHGLLADAIEQGTSQREAVNQLRDAFDSWGLTGTSRYHLDTVFRTNVLGAYAEGRYRQAQKVKRSRPFWRYVTVGDGRVRETHRAQHGKVYPADHPYWDRWTPPSGWNCRCSIETLSQAEVDDEGHEVLDRLPDEQPDKGWAGSPKLAERADKAAAKLQREANRLKTLQAPEVATRGKAPHKSAGDLGVRASRRAARIVDQLAGVDAKGAQALVADGEALVQAKASRFGPREHVAELAIPSQHLDAAEQMVRRVAGHPETTDLSMRVFARARLTPGAPPLSASEAVGLDGIARRSEVVLQWRTADEATADVLLDLLLDAEAGAEAPIRHAPEVAQLHFFSPSERGGVSRANLASRTENGRDVARVTKKPLADHRNRSVFLTPAHGKLIDTR